ncbi:hypothetical protein [Pseudonocardia acidicola]|uniref:DUF1440 domain-containing protein n=1 Tax=Pseudonocardia acidicola TaxID=2724939 RepID=A0ABX1SHA9_9PSEU|nr:hypothetical protein [Pseudonocardia acidicola]NMI00972.1 hypothetical protein [Pseudonocardia acidicola]
MRPRTRTTAGAIARGMLAGAVGTLAMDTVWYIRYRRGGGRQPFLAWETAAATTGYADASAPAQVGRRVVEGVLHVELPPGTARPMTNAVHWLTGTGWGAVYALLARSGPMRDPVVGGPALAAMAFTSSYLLLGAAGIYEPVWRYDPTTLAKDVTAHLAFGVTSAVTYRLLR